MKIEKLSVALTEELADSIRGAVESGEYASSDDVVREALLEWEYKRSFGEHSLERLRALIAEAEASPSLPWPGTDAILSEIHRRAREGNDA